MMMEYVNDKFALKCQAIKSSDYYMGSGSGLDQVMESLDSVQYYSKTSPKCVQAFGLQTTEHNTRMERSSPCGEQNG
jgi:homeoprotein 1